jgi:transposase
MEEWLIKILEEEKRKRNIPLEIKVLNGNYYLYHSTSRYDSKKHGPRKVSEYIGRITENGLKEAHHAERTVYEYGNSRFVYSLSSDLLPVLRKHFPDTWESLYALAVVRLVDPVPLKSVKERWEKIHMSTVIQAHLSPNTLTELLKETGSNMGSQYDFFTTLMKNSSKLAFDLSSIFSRSENINMAQKGHNADHEYIPQINMAMIFDLDRYMPVFLKSIDGSVRDVKSLRKVLEEISFHGVLVLDRGFASYDLADLMSSRMKFVMPLRRNSDLIDYGMKLTSSFMYRDRGILCGFSNHEGYRIYMFQDQSLMAEESSNFISLIAEKKRKQSQYDQALGIFGKISILSNVKDDPQSIYMMYKQREEIEQAFDAMKNELENDKSYLRDDDSIRGYFFVSFLSLYLYYSIFVLIRAAGLTDKISVKDALLKFSRVYTIMDGKKSIMSEIPASSAKLDEQIGTNIFPKKLGS